MEVNKSTSAVVFFAFLGVVTSLVNLKASVITGTFIKLEWQNDKKEAGMKHEFEVVLEGKRLLTNDTTVKLTSLEPGRRYLIFVNRITEGLVIQQSRTLHLRTGKLKESVFILVITLGA
ncbi:uncharacterized protein LOC119581266, partial [Penaeus monodon]|uniref:uncharacterized protein LOC119581266 n=1 Tax=Penaeus monodon TaxID=6687 RepID=UPI0018A701A9